MAPGFAFAGGMSAESGQLLGASAYARKNDLPARAHDGGSGSGESAAGKGSVGSRGRATDGDETGPPPMGTPAGRFSELTPRAGRIAPSN